VEGGEEGSEGAVAEGAGSPTLGAERGTAAAVDVDGEVAAGTDWAVAVIAAVVRPKQP
jgi:hypothetical protein